MSGAACPSIRAALETTTIGCSPDRVTALIRHSPRSSPPPAKGDQAVPSQLISPFPADAALAPVPIQVATSTGRPGPGPSASNTERDVGALGNPVVPSGDHVCPSHAASPAAATPPTCE